VVASIVGVVEITRFFLDVKNRLAGVFLLDLVESWENSRQRYLEAARYRLAAAEPRAGASWAMIGHCDACKMLSCTSYAITSYALTLCFRR
jgi:hypothetical protein